jgi:DNA-binding transcriptional regulator YhcF (GntR family)
MDDRAALGEFAPGTRLPSIRQLAADFHISPQTVQNGLRELRNDGLVVSQQGRAFFVRDPTSPVPEASSVGSDRLAAAETDLRNLEERIAAVEEDNAKLRALIMDLYGRNRTAEPV